MPDGSSPMASCRLLAAYLEMGGVYTVLVCYFFSAPRAKCLLCISVQCGITDYFYWRLLYTLLGQYWTYGYICMVLFKIFIYFFKSPGYQIRNPQEMGLVSKLKCFMTKPADTSMWEPVCVSLSHPHPEGLEAAKFLSGLEQA